MRQRLTTRIAAEDLTVKSKGETKESRGSGIDNDVYDMNDTGHEKNDPPRDEYASGDPSAWAEDPYTKPVNTDDRNRESTGHAPLVDKHAASEAIATVRKLEEKAARCIVAAQRTLPGADRQMIEDQAASFMHLPDNELNATLARQEKLAKLIVESAKKVTEMADEDEEAEEVEASSKESKKVDMRTEDACKRPVTEEVEDAEAAKKDKDLPEFLQKKLASLEAEIAMLREAAKKGKKGVSSINVNDSGMNISNASDEDEKPSDDESEKPSDDESEKPSDDESEKPSDDESEKPSDDESEKPSDDESEKPSDDKSKKPLDDKSKKPSDDTSDDGISFDDSGEKEASSDNLLDQIFSTVTASAEKKGVKTLRGLVKKEASSGSSDIDSILMEGVPPDVNHLFQ